LKDDLSADRIKGRLQEEDPIVVSAAARTKLASMTTVAPEDFDLLRDLIELAQPSLPEALSTELLVNFSNIPGEYAYQAVVALVAIGTEPPRDAVPR